MDLLVYVVQRNELNPAEIRISEIADQFLAYLDGMDRADLTEAGDFLEMASRLMALKARELLPREVQSEEELFEFDEQRSDLIRGIIEYRAFRKMSEGLQELESASRDCYGRGRREGFGRGEEGIQGRTAGVFQLYEAFSQTMKASRSLYGDAVHTVEIDFFTIQDAQQQVGNVLRHRGRAPFDELVGPDRQPMVTSTTFQALLEMVKTEQVVMRQVDPASVLWTYRKKDNADYFDELATLPPDPQDFDSDRLTEGLVELVRDRSLMRGDLLGLDDLARELTRRVKEGSRVRDRDLDHLLSGGSLSELDQQSDKPEESAEKEEEQSSQELSQESSDREEGSGDGQPSESSAAASGHPEQQVVEESEEGSSSEEESSFNFDTFFK